MSSAPPFCETFLLLQQEGFLMQSCLTQGLTSLRKAHAGDKGFYYTAFFNLSNGLERLLKSIVILAHMAGNQGIPPTRAALRAYGHDLTTLFETIRSLPVSAQPHPFVRIVAGSIEYDILEHLTEFAKITRYYNLDRLTTGNATALDPLGNWNRILMRLLEDDVPAKQKARLVAQAGFLEDAFDGHARTTMHDLNNKSLTFRAAVETAALTSAAAPYAVYRVLVIVDGLKRIVEELSDRVMHMGQDNTPLVPYMREFLDFFWLAHKRDILRKTVWP